MIGMRETDKLALRAALDRLGEDAQVRLGFRFMLLSWRDRALGFVAGIATGWWLL